MFDTNIEIIINTFKEYMGTGMYVALYVLACIYIYLTEVNKKNKALFVYFPILVLIVTMNPIFNKIIGGIFTPSTYWRLYWLFPLGITIAYAFVKLVNSIDEKYKKTFVGIALIILIMVSGRLIYREENYQKVGNLYKLPDEHVLVAQLIGADEEEYKKAIVPDNMVAHIRQVDANILLAYRREPTAYKADSIPYVLATGIVEEIVKRAESTKSNYIVFKRETVLTRPFEDFGFEKFSETTNYLIYKYTGEFE